MAPLGYHSSKLSLIVLKTMWLLVAMCEMFYFLEEFDITNFAEDSTPHNADENIEFVFNNLENSRSILFKWLNKNYMKVNTGKSNLLVYGNA